MQQNTICTKLRFFFLDQEDNMENVHFKCEDDYKLSRN